MNKKDFEVFLEKVMREEGIATTVKNKRLLKERLRFIIGEEMREKEMEFLIKSNINDMRKMLDKVKIHMESPMLQLLIMDYFMQMMYVDSLYFAC